MVAESKPKLATNIIYYRFGVIAQHKLSVFVTPVSLFHMYPQPRSATNR